jgi:signal transduction histidine kinase
MKNLFKRFSRVEHQASEKTTGVGLGLYFIKTAIQKHSGTIGFESEQGKTTFAVKLPVLK